MNAYDYIIAGGGLAGLSLAAHLSSDEWKNKRVLIIDMSDKNQNDRTWSFWSPDPPAMFVPIIRKTWPKMSFLSPTVEVTGEGRYHYHTIRGLDFYNHCKAMIAKADHIHWLKAEVESIKERDGAAEVETSSGTYTSAYVFDSIVRRMPSEDELFVWQHFMGWEIRLTSGSWDDTTARLMDFRLHQGEDTRFVYVLPFDKERALVELTLFSKDVWTEEAYEQVLRAYIEEHVGLPYEIETREIGKIPMTTATFSHGSAKIIPIGTKNGTVKPSSGYAFIRIQNEVESLVNALRSGSVKRVRHSAKYLAYDKTLLNVILSGKCTASDVFSDLFKYNKMDRVLAFLDQKTSLMTEVSIFMTLPFMPFLKAFTYENVLRPTSNLFRKPKSSSLTPS